MISKVAAVVQSKVALAALGVLLVGGSGTAVAVAATSGHLHGLGAALGGASSETQGKGASSTGDASDSHAHTVSVEGLLVACSTTTTPATISVKDTSGKTWTLVVTASTKLNGDASAAHQSGGNSAGDTGDQANALTLADICATANLNTRDVQAQATPNGAAYDAWKVTLQGPANGSTKGNGSDNGSNGKGGDNSSNGAGDSHSNATPQAEQHEWSGTVTDVSATGFTMTSDGVTYQVIVPSDAHLSGVANVAAIAPKAQVTVEGTISGATVTATSVQVESAHD